MPQVEPGPMRGWGHEVIVIVGAGGGAGSGRIRAPGCRCAIVA
jgi:hypothetical protein